MLIEQLERRVHLSSTVQAATTEPSPLTVTVIHHKLRHRATVDVPQRTANSDDVTKIGR